MGLALSNIPPPKVIEEISYDSVLDLIKADFL